jgi:hypothetical protein
VLWSPSGKGTDLNAILGPAWTSPLVQGLNNSGDIIGLGYYHKRLYGFLLTPDSATAFSAGAAPEPSTWAMMLVGLAGLGFAGYRRRGARANSSRPYVECRASSRGSPRPGTGYGRRRQRAKASLRLVLRSFRFLFAGPEMIGSAPSRSAS